MRVISPDYTINTSYENSTFCVIEDDEHHEYAVGLRNIDLKGYMPLAIYSTKEQAVKVIKEMITAAVKNEDCYVIKAE